MTYSLYARKGWGSAITEAMLTYADVDFELRDPRSDQPNGAPPLKKVNPLGQIPTLVCPDGMVLTESPAILFHIDDIAPAAALVPPSDAPERRAFLRWLQVIAGAIYPTFTYADYPARYVSGETARRELVDSIVRRRKDIWLQLEAAIQPAPWSLGNRFSGLDLYIAVMTRWNPRRRWFAAKCPKLASVSTQAESIETLQSVWVRNFKA